MKVFRSTSIFALLVLGFVAYIYFFEYRTAQEDEKLKTEGRRLIATTIDKCEELRFVKGESTVVLYKDKKNWRLREPISEEADFNSISEALRVLTTETFEDVYSDGRSEKINWAKFGLESPKGRIEIKTSEKSLSFIIGMHKSFDGRSIYIRPEGKEQVLMVSLDFGELLNKNVSDWRDKRLIRSEVASNYLYIDKKGFGTLELFRENADWQFKKPRQNWKVDSVAVESYLSSVKGLRGSVVVAESVKASELKKWGLLKNTTSVHVHHLSDKGDGKTDVIKVEISSIKDGHVYASSNDTNKVYELNVNSIKPLSKELIDFRDKSFPFDFSNEQISTFHVRHGKVDIKGKIKDGKWLMETELQGKTLDSDFVQGLISGLARLKADLFVAPKKRFQARFSDSITIENEKGDLIFKFEWGGEVKREGKKYFFARTNKSDEVMLIETLKIDGLSLDKVLKEKKQKVSSHWQKRVRLYSMAPLVERDSLSGPLT